MNSIDPWLDPTEVRRLAAQLLSPTHPPTMTATDAGFDSAFIGYAAHDDESPITPPPVQDAASEPPPDRFTRFRDWLHQQFSATGVFILDHEGSVIFDDSRHRRLHFLARSVALSSHRPDAAQCHVRVKIGVEAILEIIPVQTADSYWVLGAVVAESLDPASSALVRDALFQLVSTPAES